MPERLADPLRWRKPCRVFVNSMSDLFHERLSNGDINAVFGIMAASPHHTFQVLTKRPARMRTWFACAGKRNLDDLQRAAVLSLGGQPPGGRPGRPGYVDRGHTWPLPNVWLGVSVEDQATADQRIPLLLETPAAVRFVSYEPALGPVDFKAWLYVLDWIIAGSESGPGARPAELDWFRQTRDQCAAAGVAFFLKQWTGPATGGGLASPYVLSPRDKTISLPLLDGRQHVEWPR